ncbi:MAG: MBL fold metallo-hydrolase [Verrucomicrobia bacterium]|nr:MBL fold metallo-hydrolase [Verrucomicrobiota bacterium]
MIKPVLHDDALLADVRNAHHGRDHFHLWWLGQSGFLVQWHQHHALLDPYLSDSLTAKYAATDKPHVRMTRLAIAPERMGFVDVVTSSHNHTDHFDPDTLKPLLAVNPKLTVLVPEANRGVAAYRLNVSPKTLNGINAGDIKSLGGFRFHGIPAAHNELEQDADLNHKFLGYIIEFGRWRIYHSGDTRLYTGIEDWVRPFKVDVALLPINGDRPERKVAGNLDAREAAQLAKDIGARVAIPMHYDMFTFNTASPDDFAAECGKLGQNFRVLKCGERWSSAELGEVKRS